MNEIAVAKQIARENHAVCIRKSMDWNGDPVWGMMFQRPGEPLECIGYPQFILLNETPHAMEDEEILKYMAYLREEYPVSEDEDEDEDVNDDENVIIL